MSPRISLLATGGTISTTGTRNGAVPSQGANELSVAVDAPSVDLRPRDVAKIPSRAMTPEDMWNLASIVQEEIASGADGVVVTHGTDTLEETAYALALLVNTTVPVVLTGAMRPSDTPGADGPANLAAAVAAAANPALAPYGAVVVHQDEIHLARWVTKMHSTRVAAFASPAAGPVGAIVEGRVVPLLGPPPSTDRLRTVAPPARRVELVWVVAGIDGLVIDTLGDRVDGWVIAGTGGGHVPPPLAEALLRVVERDVPVILSSRCIDAQVLRGTYGGVGSEIHLLNNGVISAGSLPPLKARLRLLFGLSAGLPARDLFPTELDR